MSVRGLLVTLAIAASMGLASSARADASSEADLSAAEAALAQPNYEDAAKKADGVIKRGHLAHDQLIRAYRVLAMSRAVLDQEEKAREAFVMLLTYDPDYQGDPKLGPKLQQPLMEARGYWRGQHARPGIEATVDVRASVGGTLRVTTRDPSHVVKRVVAAYRWGGDAPYQRTTVQTGEQVVTVTAPPSGASRLDYYAQAFDDADDAVFEIGNPTAPKTTIVEPGRAAPTAPPPTTTTTSPANGGGSKSIFSSPVFWIAAGVVVIGGAGAIYAASHKSNDAPTSATFGPVLLCGGSKCM